MTRPRSGTWQVIATALGCAAVLLMLYLSGCASAASAGQSVATAAAANVATAAAQQAKAASVTATVSTSASSSKGVWGKWVRNGTVVNIDGTLGTGTLAEIVFNKNGSFLNTSRAGVTAVAYTKGTFEVSGSVLTTHIGKVQRAYTYQIKGSSLLLTNRTTHLTLVFQRG